MACKGCEAGASFVRDPGYTGPNPVLDPVEYTPQAGYTGSNGSCKGADCVPDRPCIPWGSIEITNCYTQHVWVHYRVFPGGNTWAWYELTFGSMAIAIGQTAEITCGSEFLMAEVWDETQDPPKKLGNVYATCSKCEVDWI